MEGGASKDDQMTVTILDIPWEQVLCKKVLPHLDLSQLFCLRRVCRQFYDLIDLYFSQLFIVNTLKHSKSLNSKAFEVLCSRNTCLKKLLLCLSKDWLTDACLVPVVQNKPMLEVIDLSHCLAISNASLYSIGVYCRQLRWISLRNCVWVSGSGLLSLITNEQHLEYVDLSGCWDLDDDIITQLVQYCKGIKTLMVNNIYGLTDRAIFAIAHECPKLKHLQVRGCWRLTDNSILMLGELCKELRALGVSSCHNISEDTLCLLRRKKVLVDKEPPPAFTIKLPVPVKVQI